MKGRERGCECTGETTGVMKEREKGCECTGVIVKEREGVNAQGITTGVRVDMGERKQPSFGRQFQQPQQLMSCIPGALFVLWGSTVLDILWMTCLLLCL